MPCVIRLVHVLCIYWTDPTLFKFYYPGLRFRSLDLEGICRKEMEKTLDPAGIHRKSPEHGSRISAGKFLDFFRTIPTTFLRFPPGTGRISPEKIPKIFQPESCFHVPMTSGVFLPEPSRILWPRYMNDAYLFEIFSTNTKCFIHESNPVL